MKIHYPGIDKRWPALVLAILLQLLFTLSCRDFFGTTDLKEDIQREVEIATAEEVTVRVSAQPATGGSLSVLGEIEKKVGEEFSLTANPAADYTFSQWTVTGGGNVTFSTPASSTTKVTITRSAEDIEIIAAFTNRPNIWPNGDYSPTGTDVLLNQLIYAQFSKEMDTSTLNETTISVTSKPVGVQGATPESIWNDFTFTTNETGFTLTPQSNMDSNSRVTIIVSKDVQDINGHTMADDFSWYFTTGDEADDAAPTFVGGLSIDKDGEFIDVPAVQMTGGAYAVDRDDILINLTGNSNSASVHVTAIEVTETDVLSGTTVTSWYGYQSPRPYSLQTVVDGEKRLDLRLQNSNGVLSTSTETVYVHRDTVEPSIASLSIASGAVFTNSLAPSLSIGAITEEGSGQYRYAGSETTAPPAEGDAAWSVIIPTSVSLSPGDGSKQVYLHVQDTAGNIGSISDDIRLDQTPPSLEPISISGSNIEYTNGSTGTDFTTQTAIGFTGGSAIDSGVGAVEYAVGFSSSPPSPGDAGWNGDLSILKTGIDISGSDGLKTIYLHARDSLGNTTDAASCVSDSVVLDTAAPHIDSDFRVDVSPKVQGEGADTAWYTNSSTVHLSGGEATDATDHIEYRLVQESTYDSGWTTHASITAATYLLTAAQNTFTLYARDPLNSPASLSRDITLDTASPVFAGSPSSLGITSAGNVTVGTVTYTNDTTWNISGPSASDAGVGTVTYAVSTTAAPPVSGWSSSIPSLGLGSAADGQKTVRLHARDALENTATFTSTASRTLDTTGPAIEKSSGDLNATATAISTFTTADSGAGVDGTAYTLTGGSSGSFSGTQMTGLTDPDASEITYSLGASDTLGNSSEICVKHWKSGSDYFADIVTCP